MGLIWLWLMAGTLVLSAVIFGWVAILAHPLGRAAERRSRGRDDDELVRLACADLDAEYRQLLEH